MNIGKDLEELNEIGKTLIDEGKYEEAIECFDKALELDPTYIRAYNNKGCVFEALNKHEEAIECYDKAIELNPDDHETYNNKQFVLSKLNKKGEA